MTKKKNIEKMAQAEPLSQNSYKPHLWAGRPVIIKDKDWKTKEERERKATFHVWGYQRFARKGETPTFQTVAIVELEDGRITSKLPDYVTFAKAEARA